LAAAATWYRRTRLIARAGHLASTLAAAPDDRPSLWWDAITQFPEFNPLQRRDELIWLATRVRHMKALRICEIGTAAGGTLCALARAAPPEARIVTVDLSLPWARRVACRRLGQRGQRIECIEGDSHATATRDRVTAFLGESGWDLLLIDGDHSRSGVERDFSLYSPAVRPGGLIVLHDIVPDVRRRLGIATSADSGDVPEFWRSLKARYPRTEEIVDDEQQDACGLGVITL
jgi:predicted O-methyltransferase YrrM